MALSPTWEQLAADKDQFVTPQGYVFIGSKLHSWYQSFYLPHMVGKDATLAREWAAGEYFDLSQDIGFDEYADNTGRIPELHARFDEVFRALGMPVNPAVQAHYPLVCSNYSAYEMDATNLDYRSKVATIIAGLSAKYKPSLLHLGNLHPVMIEYFFSQCELNMRTTYTAVMQIVQTEVGRVADIADSYRQYQQLQIP